MSLSAKMDAEHWGQRKRSGVAKGSVGWTNGERSRQFGSFEVTREEEGGEDREEMAGDVVGEKGGQPPRQEGRQEEMAFCT